MANEIQVTTLVDAEGNPFYPPTSADQVIDFVRNKSVEQEITELNENLKEIYKEMYIPNVKRYTVSASLSANEYIDKVITFDEPIDLAHSKVNLVGYYRHDASVYEAHPTYYFAQITNITSNNCTVNLKNNHTGSHVLEAIVEVEEWKKPTE